MGSDRVLKVLYVGDAHATVSELPDMDKLMSCIKTAVVEHKPELVCFLGDQFHNHGIVHLEVMHWWLETFRELALELPVWALVGNHDKPDGRSPGVHALEAMKHINDVTIVDEPCHLYHQRGILALPHMDEEKEFRKGCLQYPDVSTVVCHNTFDGAQLENGYYAPYGFSTVGLPQKLFLSGHVHLPQDFGSVWYLGAPRWRIATDANTERAIWVVTHDEKGAVVERTPVDTGPYCRRIIDIQETEEIGVAPEMYDTRKDDVRLTITGPDWFLKGKVPGREDQGFKVRTIKTGTQAAPRVKESEGVSTAFQKFARAYEPKFGTPSDVLVKLAAERLAHAQ